MSMFCFQCQETAKNSGCTIQGVCGKKEDIANLQDELVRQLKILAVQLQDRKDVNEAGLVAVQSLFMTITNA
ncbi:MAG: hydroxylamine reductase, partial [Lentisphaeria bacterium]|nr:hydroxylamine reductase [Lentisphaeria bacterium]